jgi:hypothetical protein
MRIGRRPLWPRCKTGRSVQFGTEAAI